MIERPDFGRMCMYAVLITELHTEAANARPNVRWELRWGWERLFHIDTANTCKTTFTTGTGTRLLVRAVAGTVSYSPHA